MSVKACDGLPQLVSTTIEEKEKNIDKVTAIFDVVRHGQTTYNAENPPRIQGNLPIPLSDEGIKQVTRLAESLKENHYDICYNSIFRRAEQSSEIIEEVFSKAGIKLTRVPDKRIRERERGAFAGKTDDEFDAASESDRLRETETDELLTARVFDFINEKGPLHLGQKVLVVSHERVICKIILKLNPDKKIQKILVENTAVLRVAYTRGQASIVSMKGITIKYS